MNRTLHLFMLALGVLLIAVARAHADSSNAPSAGDALRKLNLETQPKVVKIFGVGGLRQLEAYQTGIFVSADGHVLTPQSLVLDEGTVTVVMWNGARAAGTVTAVDPLTELALVKISVEEPVEWFRLDEQAKVEPGTRIVAFANVFGIAVYDEPVSMLQGVVSGLVPLTARRGAIQSNYTGDVYVVDAATNNPGAAGGAIVDFSGKFLGLIGKELRSESTGAWLNYALPVSALREPVERMTRGGPPPVANPSSIPADHPTAAHYGIVLVPDVLERTPPYVDRVVADSSAALAGLRADDLIVSVAGQTVGSRRDLERVIAATAPDQPLEFAILRGKELRRVSLTPPGGLK
jgi:serine protease Do